ncbi:MAG: cysteine desulfurase [Actinobacteria bacterium]|nr:cysteine desulfurase [Actinomycetota bacterium]
MSIYLDNNATTPVHPRVAEVIERHLRGAGGNPSSDHPAGREAAAAVARARGQVAVLLGCDATEIVFTGSGSEGNNLALKGIAYAYRDRGRHLVISATEHPAVVAPARFLEREGWELTVVPVGPDGRVRPGDVARALRPDTVLVSIMHSNNETGVMNPVVPIAALCRERGVLFHTDGAQSAGKVPIHVRDDGIDLLTVAGHKMGAPKGVGALFVRGGVKLEPLIHGAGHEGGRRAGTENVPYVAGLGEAAALAREEGLAAFATRVRPLRDRLHGLLTAGIPDLELNGHPTDRLPNTLNVSVPGALGRELLAACPEVEASTGSACHEGEDSPSGVLVAMGLLPERALGALRLTLGLSTSECDVERAAAALLEAVDSRFAG